MYLEIVAPLFGKVYLNSQGKYQTRFNIIVKKIKLN